MRLDRPREGAPELLERDADIALLGQVVGQAGDRSGRIVVVEGAAGIGKTSLLTRGSNLATAAGMPVLSARGHELERDHPFGVVRQLLRSRDGTGPPTSTSGGGDELSLALTADLDRAVEHGDGPNAGAVPYALLHRLYWWVVTAAGPGPLVISIDDLHWCDRPSLRFLTFLAPRLEDHRIVIMASLRSADASTDAHLLTTLLRDPIASTIRPQPLSEGAVALLVEQVLGAQPEPAFTAACHHATGGNPELMTELLAAVRHEHVPPTAFGARSIADVGPRAIVRSVLQRLLPLPEPTIRVARALAVLGDKPPTAAVAALGRVDVRQVGEATRRLVEADILSADPDRPLAFVHPLVHDVVYRDLAPAEREEQHLEAAEWLLEAHAPIEQAVAHLLVVTPRGLEWVAAALRRAAEQALMQSAPETAVTYLRRALVEPVVAGERAALLWELGRAEMLVDEAAAALHLAAAYAAESDPLVRATIAAQLARVSLFLGPPEAAAAIAAQAAVGLPDSLLDQRRSLLALELYARHFGSPGRTVPHLLPTEPDEVAGGGPGSRMLLATAAWGRALAGEPGARCLALARAALEDGTLLRTDPGFMGIVAVGVLALADADDAVSGWHTALAIAQRTGSLFAVSGLHLWQGWTWLQRGELLEAESVLRMSLEETERYNVEGDAGMAYAYGFLARVLLEQGKTADATEALSRAGRPVAGSDADAVCTRARIEILLSRRRYQEALVEADRAEQRLGHIANPAWLPWRTLRGLAAVHVGRHDLAPALLDAELVQARRWGAPGALGAALRHQGEQQGETGLDLLREAVEVTADSPARLEYAKALLALGAALRRSGQRMESRAPLGDALEIAVDAGAHPVLERARTELLAAGGRRRGTVARGVRSLTPSERRVAELATTGLSNRDIARSLYVTTKTVEVHLSNSYRKLGITSRAQLLPQLQGSLGS